MLELDWVRGASTTPVKGTLCEELVMQHYWERAMLMEWMSHESE